MHSVQCRIRRADKLQIGIAIGVDDGDKPFWKRTGKSPVSFHEFTDASVAASPAPRRSSAAPTA